MTTPVTAEAFTEADEDETLIPIFFASAYCLVSSPLIFESFASVEDGTRTPPIRRRRKTIEGLLQEYGERNFERAYPMSFASFCDLHTLLHSSIARREDPRYQRGGLRMLLERGMISSFTSPKYE